MLPEPKSSMMRIFTLLLFLGCAGYANAQIRTVSGRLLDSGDNPMPGINVVIKGTATGTTTDADGYYTIDVPVGATLVFSFVGMKTSEVVVTADNFSQRSPRVPPQGKTKVTPSFSAMLLKDSTQTQEPGVAVLTDETPSYSNRASISPDQIKSIRLYGKKYSITTFEPHGTNDAASGRFTLSVGLERVNKLPSLQTTFAPGRPVNGQTTWQGPDQQEIFSWGPLVRTLEFDGSSYPFDRQGRLVPAGTGNGNAAQAYDASRIFRTGMTTSAELLLMIPALKKGMLSLDLENRTRSGVIPNTDYKRQNISVALKRFRLTSHTTVDGMLTYNHSAGTLMNRGANLATIVGSIYRTPATFDNTNGLGPSALHATEAYKLADGTARTHAPGAVDNPYGLLSTLPDHEKQNRFFSTLTLQSTVIRKLKLTGNASFEKQGNTIVHGFPIGYAGYPSGRLTHRDDDETVAKGFVSPEYTSPNEAFKFSASYQLHYTQRTLHREDGFDFNGPDLDFEDAMRGTRLQRTISRTVQETSVGGQYRLDDFLLIKLSERNYFSSTVNSRYYTNLFPMAAVSANLASRLYVDPIDKLEPYFSVSRSLHEAPLLYNNWSYLSTRQSLQTYNRFFESTELFFRSGLLPETERKLETGLSLIVFYNLNFDFAYFNNLTSNFIAPLWTQGRFSLQNVASIRNTGTTASLSYSRSVYASDELGWGVNLRWSSYRTVAEALNTPDTFVPLAGFESVASVLAAGKPVGAIYGTTYLRNENGQRVIDSDGYPVIDPSLKMIGNPIPDWVSSLGAHVNWQRITVSILVDYKKGGDAWNGTARMLDYLGRSATTADQRNISQFVFEGVDEHGHTNTKPVDFANPNQPVESNRWVRQGWAGVGEDYIQKTSWLRLNEVTLSYSTLRSRARRFVKEMNFALTARNLLLITPYKGVDPSSTLFGYSTGAGLDLFNTPATRSYSALITLKF